jgi:UPF0755 protein
MKQLLLVIGALLLFSLVGAGAYGYWKYQRLLSFAETPRDPPKEVVVSIAPGTGPKAMSDQLAMAGVVEDAQLFLFHIRYVRRVAGRLKAGDYRFRPGEPQTPDQIADRLLKGEILSLKITVPEGLRIEEQAPLFAAAGLGSEADFVRLARDPAFARSAGVEADSLEGYLFPDTYLVPKNATTEQILKLMVERFRGAWAAAEAQRDPKVALSRHQAVTLASIVEKETGAELERPRISCVFHNRLRRDMKLQTDPTVLYSMFLRTGVFSKNIRKVDLETPHPYNTYAVKGLPPGPIANAGQAALTAALHPMLCDDLFFVSKNDGTHVFCPDLGCHEANVEKWQREYWSKQRRAQK